MRRRKFILGLGSATVGGSALVGSGALSGSVSQRDVTIETVGDEDAYLRLVYENHTLEDCPDEETLRLVELTNQLKHDIDAINVEISGTNPDIGVELVTPDVPPLKVGESTEIEVEVECDVVGTESTTVSFDVETVGDDGSVTAQDRTIEITCVCAETTWAKGEEFSGSNWAMYVPFAGGEEFTTELVAGRDHKPVGTLDVTWIEDGDVLSVTYDADYTLAETHLHVAENLEDIPAANGNPIPGQFEFSKGYSAEQHIYEIEAIEDGTVSVGELEEHDELYIAAHGEIR